MNTLIDEIREIRGGELCVEYVCRSCDVLAVQLPYQLATNPPKKVMQCPRCGGQTIFQDGPFQVGYYEAIPKDFGS